MNNDTANGDHNHSPPGKGRFARDRQQRHAVTKGPDLELYVYGIHASEFALRNPRREVNAVWATENAERRLAEALALREMKVHRATPRELDKRVGSDAVHQGIVLEVRALAPIDLQEMVERAAESHHPILLLDQVTDPQNVGAVLRSAAVFGAAGLVMTYRHSPPLGAALAKAASGALDLIPVCHVQNLSAAMTELKRQSFAIIGLDGTGPHRLLEDGLGDRRKQNVALALGAEGKGLRELTLKSCDELCRIGGDGPIASLNVSNAAAIALHLAAMLRR